MRETSLIRLEDMKPLIQAIFNRDYPMVQASALFLATVFVVINTGVDLLYGYLDPRIKHA